MKELKPWLFLLLCGVSLSLGATLYAGEGTLGDPKVEALNAARGGEYRDTIR